MSPNEDIRARALEIIKRHAEALVRDAELHGVVLTIVQSHKLPLAIDNYETVVTVRPAREVQ